MAHAQLRPLAFGEILDGAFALYRRHFSTFFLGSLLPLLPALAVGLLAALVVTAAGSAAAALAAVGLLLLLLAPLLLGCQVLQWSVLTDMVSQAYTGHAVSVGVGVSRGLVHFLPLLGATIIAAVLVLVGLVFLVVPGLLLACMFFAVAPAVVVERRGPITALSRSRELASGAWGRIFLLVTVAYIIAALPSWGLQGISRLSTGVSAGELILQDPVMYGVVQLISLLISALTLPFVVGAIVLLYYDRRVRAEALDVELATEGLAAAG
ncbi:MAG TPA: hypothetical protein VFX98_09715 [Longimicrobiaceae bacterium]|nr:hypothetical protein [Longimicrobiaceae bacterium]